MKKRQASSAPTRKVTAGAIAGGIMTGVAWALQTFAGVELPPQLQGTLIMLLTFVVSYLTPPASRDELVPR